MVDRFRSHSRFAVITEEEISDAMNTTIIRPAVHHTVKECTKNLLESIRSSPDLHPNAVHNDLLAEAIGNQEISDVTASLLRGDGADNGLLYMVNTISTAVLACATFLDRCSQLIASASGRKQDSSSSTNQLPFLSGRETITLRLMSRCQERLEEQQSSLRELVQSSGRKQEKILGALIEEHYSPDSPRLIRQQSTLDRLHRYSERLIRIACELQTAQDRARFTGETLESGRGRSPIIGLQC